MSLLMPFVVSQDTEKQWKGAKGEGDPCKLRLWLKLKDIVDVATGRHSSLL